MFCKFFRKKGVIVMKNFSQINEMTKKLNQWGDPADLIELIYRANHHTGDPITREQAATAAESICLSISLVLDIWAKDPDLTDIYEWLEWFYGQDYIGWDAARTAKSYQMKPSKEIIAEINREIKPSKLFQLVDVDSRDAGWSRAACMNSLQARVTAIDFLCCRVCFSSGGGVHALIVAKNESGYPVVCDTSGRSHTWPMSAMEKYITAENILWYTEVLF